LAHVNDLAGQFFSGNLDEAFNQAVNLGYDKSQIGSFALSLVQVDIKPEAETPKVDTDTAAAAQPSNLPLFSLSDHLHPLGNFIKILLDALDLASKFDNPKGLLSDASINLVGKDDAGKVQAARFDNFSKQLLSLDLGKSTQSPDDVAAKN